MAPSFSNHYHGPHPPFPPPRPPPSRPKMCNSGIQFECKNTNDLNSKIMVTAIISLFAALLVTAGHIFARCILRRRQAHNRAIIPTLGLTVAAENYSGELPKTVLDPSVIDSLPIFVYKQSCHFSKGDDDCNDGSSFIECAVCLCFLEDQELARTLPNCKHTFHAECIDKWLSSHSNCPICRTEAEPRIQPLQREGPSGGGAATAPPPLEVNCILDVQAGTSSESVNRLSPKLAAGGGSSISRLSSFQRILSRERSSTRLQSDQVQEQGFEDIERQ